MKIRHGEKLRWTALCDLSSTWLAILCIWFAHEAIKWQRSDSLKQCNGIKWSRNNYKQVRSHGKMKRHAFDKFVFKTLYQGASTSIRNCFSKARLNQRKECTRLRVSRTLFSPFSCGLWKAEVSVSDDVTVSSDLGRDKNVSLPTFVSFNLCSKDLQHVLSVKCLSLLLCGDLNPSRPTLDDPTEFRSHWVR